VYDEKRRKEEFIKQNEKDKYNDWENTQQREKIRGEQILFLS